MSASCPSYKVHHHLSYKFHHCQLRANSGKASRSWLETWQWQHTRQSSQTQTATCTAQLKLNNQPSNNQGFCGSRVGPTAVCQRAKHTNRAQSAWPGVSWPRWAPEPKRIVVEGAEADNHTPNQRYRRKGQVGVVPNHFFSSCYLLYCTFLSSGRGS